MTSRRSGMRAQASNRVAAVLDWSGRGSARVGPNGSDVRLRPQSASQLLRQLEEEEDDVEIGRHSPWHGRNRSRWRGNEEGCGDGLGLPRGHSFATLMDQAAARYSGVSWATAAALIDRRLQQEEDTPLTPCISLLWEGEEAEQEKVEEKEEEKVAAEVEVEAEVKVEDAVVEPTPDVSEVEVEVVERIVAEKPMVDVADVVGDSDGSVSGGDAEWCLVAADDGEADDDADFLIVDDDLL